MALLTYTKVQRDPIDRFLEALEATGPKPPASDSSTLNHVPKSEPRRESRP